MPNNLTKLKILISCGSYSWGGLEMVALQQAEKLHESGSNVKIICAEDSTLEKESKGKNIDVIPVYSSNKKTANSISKLARYIKKLEPDVIHTHLSHDLWVLTPALKMAGSKAKLFLTKHIASGVKKKDIFHRYLYKRVSGIFSVSSYINESVINTCPVPREKIHVLPNGIDLGKFNPDNYDSPTEKKRLNIPSGRTVISIIGRMTPGKGHEEFLHAAAFINEKNRDKVFFMVVGTASAGEEEYEKKIRAMKDMLELQNIIFTGYIDDIRGVLAATDILAFPSHNESFGVTLIEAMAMGVPAAASGEAGVLDIITDGETGLLFRPKSSEQLAEALARLLEDMTLRAKLAAEGRKRVEEKFDIDVITKKLTGYYTGNG